jgi:hypothetical protein
LRYRHPGATTDIVTLTYNTPGTEIDVIVTTIHEKYKYQGTTREVVSYSHCTLDRPWFTI